MAAIGLVVIALLVPSIVRSLRMDTIGGTVVAGSGARPSGSWQVSLVIPEQSQAVVFGARTARQGGGFVAVARTRGATRVIPSAGATADVQLGS